MDSFFFLVLSYDFWTLNIWCAHRSLTPVHNLGHASRKKMKLIAIPQESLHIHMERMNWEWVSPMIWSTLISFVILLHRIVSIASHTIKHNAHVYVLLLFELALNRGTFGLKAHSTIPILFVLVCLCTRISVCKCKNMRMDCALYFYEKFYTFYTLKEVLIFHAIETFATILASFVITSRIH